MSREREAVRRSRRRRGSRRTPSSTLEDALQGTRRFGLSRHASVELDPSGDFRVYSIELLTDIGA
jgi:hypothetical protein